MKKVLTIARALSDENRVRALMMLQKGEMCVCRIIEMLQLAPSTVSKHMSILKQADLVATRRSGKWTYYRLADRESDSDEAEIIAWLQRRLKDDPKTNADLIRLAGAPASVGGAETKSCPCAADGGRD